MKKLLIVCVVVAIVGSGELFGQLPYPVRVDSQSPTVPTLEVYRANERTFRFSYFDGTNPVVIGGAVPFLSWATSMTADSMVTSAWSRVGSHTGVVDFTWSPPDLNVSPGRYYYETGLVTNNATTVFRHGRILIYGSPFSAGAAPVVFTTNLNLSLINVTGAFGDQVAFDGGLIVGQGEDLYFVSALEDPRISTLGNQWSFYNPNQSGSIAFTAKSWSMNTTNMAVWHVGELNGTNGIYYPNRTTGTNFWLLEN